MNISVSAMAQLKINGWRFNARFRGPQGSGKTTKAELTAKFLRSQGYETKLISLDDGSDEVWIMKRTLKAETVA